MARTDQRGRNSAIGDPMHARALILQVPISLRHSYLGQLWQIADILPTYCRQRNKTRRDYRYKMVGVVYTKRDIRRYGETG